jgi:hypothetical protein
MSVSDPFRGSEKIKAPGVKGVSATSWRNGETHETEVRIQEDRQDYGNVIFRRFANGVLCLDYAKNAIVDIVHKAQLGGSLTPLEKASLSVILPLHFQLMDEAVCKTMLHLSKEEIKSTRDLVMRHFSGENNYNAGRGGSVNNAERTKA